MAPMAQTIVGEATDPNEQLHIPQIVVVSVASGILLLVSVGAWLVLRQRRLRRLQRRRTLRWQASQTPMKDEMKSAEKIVGLVSFEDLLSIPSPVLPRDRLSSSEEALPSLVKSSVDIPRAYATPVLSTSHSLPPLAGYRLQLEVPISESFSKELGQAFAELRQPRSRSLLSVRTSDAQTEGETLQTPGQLSPHPAIGPLGILDHDSLPDIPSPTLAPSMVSSFSPTSALPTIKDSSLSIAVDKFAMASSVVSGRLMRSSTSTIAPSLSIHLDDISLSAYSSLFQSGALSTSTTGADKLSATGSLAGFGVESFHAPPFMESFNQLHAKPQVENTPLSTTVFVAETAIMNWEKRGSLSPWQKMDILEELHRNDSIRSVRSKRTPSVKSRSGQVLRSRNIGKPPTGPLPDTPQLVFYGIRSQVFESPDLPNFDTPLTTKIDRFRDNLPFVESANGVTSTTVSPVSTSSLSHYQASPSGGGQGTEGAPTIDCSTSSSMSGALFGIGLALVHASPSDVSVTYPSTSFTSIPLEVVEENPDSESVAQIRSRATLQSTDPPTIQQRAQTSSSVALSINSIAAEECTPNNLDPSRLESDSEASLQHASPSLMSVIQSFPSPPVHMSESSDTALVRPEMDEASSILISQATRSRSASISTIPIAVSTSLPASPPILEKEPAQCTLDHSVSTFNLVPELSFPSPLPSLMFGQMTSSPLIFLTSPSNEKFTTQLDVFDLEPTIDDSTFVVGSDSEDSLYDTDTSSADMEELGVEEAEGSVQQAFRFSSGFQRGLVSQVDWMRNGSVGMASRIPILAARLNHERLASLAKEGENEVAPVDQPLMNLHKSRIPLYVRRPSFEGFETMESPLLVWPAEDEQLMDEEFPVQWEDVCASPPVPHPFFF